MKDSKVVKYGRQSSEIEMKEYGQKDRSTYGLLNPPAMNIKQIHHSENCHYLYVTRTHTPPS